VHRLLSWRLLALVVSLMLAIGLLVEPEIEWPRRVYRYQFVIDITQSMNARDYHLAGYPQDRLEFVKKALLEALHDLPCGSEVGLGLFTTQSVHFLLEPIEICRHFSVIDDVLRHVDWRMAWSADTHVEVAVYQALREIMKRDASTRLVFFTDGQETPPQAVKPQYEGAPKAIQGLLVGVGGRTPITVPRFDRDMNSLGVWENADIEKPPISSTVYSERVDVRTLPTEGPYLSWMDEAHLKEMAAITGLGFVTLDHPDTLKKALLADDLAELRPALTDLRPGLGLCLLLIFLLAYAVERDGRKRPTSR
jgi:mxaL protein